MQVCNREFLFKIYDTPRICVKSDHTNKNMKRCGTFMLFINKAAVAAAFEN